jgi:hypothetical protein
MERGFQRENIRAGAPMYRLGTAAEFSSSQAGVSADLTTYRISRLPVDDSSVSSL